VNHSSNEDFSVSAQFCESQAIVSVPHQPSNLEKLLTNLKAAQPLHLEVWQKMMQANGGAFYPVDFLAQAVLNRSLNLVDGFTALAKRRNLICCGALLRLQIDNCLRFYAVYLVKDPHEFALKVFDGVPIRKLKDRNGDLMTDRHLVAKLSKKYPWVSKVYERTSGYIHLSETHIFSTFRATSKEQEAQHVQEIGIGIGCNREDNKLMEEATEAFIEATEIMFEYLVGWVKTKNNPPKRSKNS
jgi:hypothetical protein